MTNWSEIVRQHGPLVWRTAYRLLSNEADASDCFQDAFVSAVKLSRRETIHNWSAILKRLATARALERLRKRYHDANRSEAWPDAPVSDERSPDPSQKVLDGEIANNIREALTQIDVQQSEVFCLIVLEDFSYRDVAKQLGISVNHVGVLLHRAKHKLQNLLANHNPSFPGESRARQSNGHS